MIFTNLIYTSPIATKMPKRKSGFVVLLVNGSPIIMTSTRPFASSVERATL